MTLLTIVQDVCAEVGVPRPTAVYAATDPTMRAMLSHAQEEGRSLSRLGPWQALRKEKTFTSLAQETQTAMVATDLARFVDKTFWNRTRKRPFRGPVTPQEWQSIKASTGSMIRETFTYRGNAILINPSPAAGDTFAYEYISNEWCQATGGGATRSAWAADSDVGLLDERLIKLGIIWRFKKQRGLAFDADYALYEFAWRNAMAQESPHDDIDMSNAPRWPRPGVGVVEGDWYQ